MKNDYGSEIQEMFYNFHTDLDLMGSLLNVLTSSISNEFEIENKDFANLIFIMKFLTEKMNERFEKIISKLKI